MIPNKPNNKCDHKHFSRVCNTCGADMLTSSYEQGVRDAVGNIGAGLLAQHSPQAVLDAYFDVANKELEKYETDN